MLLLLNVQSTYINDINKKKPNNILLHIKNKLQNVNYTPNNKKIKIHQNDFSISIHVCDTMYHEVEILYNNIIHILKNNNDIMMHEIIIVSQNISMYSPYIKTIFNSPNIKYHIPYVICDMPNQNINTALRILHHIFYLPSNIFENENIFSILECLDIAKKFSINEEEIKILKKWTNNVNIKWGFDTEHTKSITGINIHTNTWQFGINRMLIGCALKNELEIWNNIVPYNDPEGKLTNIVNKLMIFILTLYKWKKKLSHPKTLTTWLPTCQKIINIFIYKKTDLKKEFMIIQHEWKKIVISGIKCQYTKKINICVLYDQLVQKIKNRIIKKNITIGKIGFCNMKSIHTIPFKVIYILGINNKNFSNQDNQLHLDLLKFSQKVGDPSLENEYRYAFLHIINSVEKYIYISYPKYQYNHEYYQQNYIIINELLDYIYNNFKISQSKQKIKNINNIKNYIIHDHNKNSDDTIYHTNTSQFNILKSQKKFLTQLPYTYIKSINFKKFVLFWKNPIYYFFNKQLNIKHNIHNYLHTEHNTEPFLINYFNQHTINQDIIEATLQKKNTNLIFQFYKQQGMLPNKNFDVILWEKQKEEVDILSKKLYTIYKNHNTQYFNIKIKNCNIYGHLLIIQKNKIIRWKPNKLYFSDAIQLWFEHLIYCIIGGTKSSKIFGLPNIEWKFLPMNPNLAYINLNHYLVGYWNGLHHPLFLTKSGISWIQTIYDNNTNTLLKDQNSKNQANKKFLHTWIGNNKIIGEKNNIYIQKIIPMLNINNMRYIKKIAKNWILPILKKKKISQF